MTIAVGIDVAKETVEVAISDGRGWGEYSRCPDGLADLAERLGREDVSRIVVEATGGYEQLVLHQLHEAGFDLVLVQPVRARHFARGLGFYAKTDPIDAAVLAKMAATAVDNCPLWKPLESAVAELRALVEARLNVVDQVDALRKRLRSAKSALVRASLERLIDSHKAEQAALEAAIDQVLSKNNVLQEQVEALCETKGVGKVAATSTLAFLPELGVLPRRQIACLAGVAPINRDSGKREGRRYIYGGRRKARRALYMATLVATRHNDVIRAAYRRLLKRGKAKKVALIACMRKLLLHMNSVMRSVLSAQTAAAPVRSVA